jgi:hypothetical protein
MDSTIHKEGTPDRTGTVGKSLVIETGLASPLVLPARGNRPSPASSAIPGFTSRGRGDVHFRWEDSLFYPLWVDGSPSDAGHTLFGAEGLLKGSLEQTSGRQLTGRLFDTVFALLCSSRG